MLYNTIILHHLNYCVTEQPGDINAIEYYTSKESNPDCIMMSSYIMRMLKHL